MATDYSQGQSIHFTRHSANRLAPEPRSALPKGMSHSFVLDPRLDADTLPVIELPLCSVRLMRDATYPWLVLVPRLDDVSEIIDLAELDRRWLMEEIAKVSTALKAITSCDKLNVAALGNQVAQLHVHVIARVRGDAAWPAPVWGKVPPTPYHPSAQADMLAKLRARLGGSV